MNTTLLTENKTLPIVDIFLNPEKKLWKAELKDRILNAAKAYFTDPSFHKSYPALFKLLWHSALPCSPTPGVTTQALLKKCSWSGQAMDCSQLFQTIPTDSGMCCAFNYVSTLRKSNYSELMNTMNGKKSVDKKARKAKVGKRNGLRIVLDQHASKKSVGTLSKDYNALQFFVGGSTEFPLMRDRGFLLDPGKEHFIEISGISIKANPDIKNIHPVQRNCFFSDESSLSYHSQYTYSSCKFETGLSLAMEKQNCTPWFLPTDPGREGEVCDPWRAMDFTREMERGEATHCLQDCQGTKYSTQRSSAAFRSENQKSSLLLCCALFPDLVTPRI